MPTVCIITDNSDAPGKLVAALAGDDFVCTAVATAEEAVDLAPSLVLLDVDSHAGMAAISQAALHGLRVRTIILGRLDTLAGLNSHLRGDDFVVKPYDVRELVLRAKRLLHRTAEGHDAELITCGDLAIDTAQCEVTIAGHPVVLTFREYELLRFLASNPGRVFTRDALLDHVWGHDFFGGDRTVDVHVRRLRSKIESSGHSFIETVRNVGYRFCRYS